MTRVVIASAVRTPVGKFQGGLSSVPSYDLGTIVMKEVLSRAKVEAGDVSEVIFGQVLTAGLGQNPARHASLKAGIPNTVPACTVNQVCGSGLRAVALGYQAIKCNDANIVVAGGQENMTMSPHCIHIRSAVRKGTAELKDSMETDGLTDCIHKCAMGDTAEAVAEIWKISRNDQDHFALTSQKRAGISLKEGKFKEEIIPVTVHGRRGEETVVSQDEFPRPQTTLEGLQKLKPGFVSGGSVTVGNCTGINDGAAALLLMSKEEADKRALTCLCTITSWAHAGVDPMVMGVGPIPAIKKALEKAKWTIDEVDLFEINEAFAAQSLAVIRELEIDPKRVNVNGGAIALGHPIGASGARILVTLLHAMKHRDVKRGMAALCVGGGMGVALCVER